MEDNYGEDVADEADAGEAGDEDALNHQLQPGQLVLFSLYILSPTAVIHFSAFERKLTSKNLKLVKTIKYVALNVLESFFF